MLWLTLLSLSNLAVAQDTDAVCQAQDATEWSLVEGYPLLAFQRAYSVLRLENLQPNILVPSPTLANPQSTAIVKPNRDTLSGGMFYDVSEKDLEITLPEVDERYHSAAFYTPYGDNFLNLGPINNNPTGTYRLTIATSMENLGTVTTNNTTEDYQGTIFSPTTFGIMLYRIAVKDYDTDIPLLQSYIENLTATEIHREGLNQGPQLSDSIFTNLPNTTAENIMELSARFMNSVVSFNTTGHGSPSTTSNFSAAGISPNSYSPPSCVSLTSAWSVANKSIEAFPYTPGSVINLGNGWTIVAPEYSGLFGENIEARAYVAYDGYLMLTPEQAGYPVLDVELALDANESYVLHFSGKPPLEPLGFWSVTMYDAASTLVENSIDRYALGDRDNLTYTDGSLVYSDVEDNDGPFEILIQAQQPPDNWTSNWLPSPEEPGPFQILLRWYVPSEALYDGSYEYPLITKGGAIVGNMTGQEGAEVIGVSSGSAVGNGTTSGAESSGAVHGKGTGLRVMTMWILCSSLSLAYL